MYVGTCYAAMGNTLTLMDTTLGDNFDKDIMTAALKAMFNGTFFYGHEKKMVLQMKILMVFFESER